ncbi:MAG TPA: hypothetical protein VFN77_06180, partial [Acetobacteraceae bacterium]|nr:hypothetical protein [Acetobacteraceae bacterium]
RMSGENPSGPDRPSSAERTVERTVESLARDWIELWQSELAAMAADRELREGWTQMLSLWAGAASSAVEAGMRMARHDGARGSSASHDAARAAPGAAAPDAGRDEIERLHRRIADLEARLAAMEERKPRPG